MNRPSIPRRLLVDLAIAAVLLAGSGVWATRFWNAWTASGNQPFFYQNYFEPAVMIACGKGFVVAQAPRPQALEDFLNRRRDAMTCADLPAGLTTGKQGLFQGTWIYLQTTVGLAWRVLGISWSRMGPLFGLMFGVVVALVYAIFRVGMGRAAAVAGAIAIATSSTHLVNLPNLRDYAKAPFTLALVLIVGLLVTRPVRRSALVMLGVAYGLILGIGYGFRTDFLIDVPVFPIAVFAFVGGGLTRNLASKGLAAAACLAAFAVVSWPVISAVREQGGCQWHVALLGLQSTFDDSLGVAPAAYDFGYAYSDDFVTREVQGFAHRMQPDAPVLRYCQPDYDAQSWGYLRAIAGSFPADVIARAYGSILQIAELPFSPSKSSLSGWATSFLGMRADILQPRIGWGAYLVALATLLAASTSLRAGCCLLFFLVYFGGYPAIQFQERHYFHLEFMTWWAAGFVAHHTVARAWAARTSRPAGREVVAGLRRAAAFALVAVVGAWVVLMVARWYQQNEATAIISSYDAAAKIALAPSDGALSGIAPRAWPQYVEVDFDQARCGPRPAVTFRHAATPIAGDLSRTVTILHRSSAPGITRVLQPVHESFLGLEYSDARPGCVTGAYRLEGVQALPLLLAATLPPDWRTLPLHQRVRDLERDPLLPALVPVPASPWTNAAGRQLSANRAGMLTVVGDRSVSGYQLTSPAVRVGSGAHVLVHANLAIWNGRICLGIMDGATTRWMTPPIASAEYISFTAEASGTFMVAAVNCRATRGWFPSLFTVRSMSYAID